MPPLAVVLRRDDLLLATDRRVLRADEVKALQDGADVLRFAHEEAERIRAQARDDARDLEARLRDAARDEIERRGAQAAADAQVHAAGLLADVQRVAAQAVVEAVTRLAAGLDRSALFAKALDDIATMIDARHVAVLRVAQVDAAIVADAIARMSRTSRLPSTLAVRVDPAVSPGDCVLQTPGGRTRFGITPLVTALATSMQAWLERAAEERRAAAAPAPADGSRAAAEEAA